ncbi:PAS domain S-box protein [Aliidiomarina taiwanensis]|uniref:PAS domain S-box protein n=1 Tax=Aliidiomarina taiwanensis TaxID=946228 RepID=A0A432XAF1_9GAMM|nr:sensor domain-containing diguanylate cyclase [Aliidiomarina taiwanensis]RUO44304.1 PAS domain S-box protein [Aliidiomarina taiwanensis]
MMLNISECRVYRYYADFLNTIPDGALVVTKEHTIRLANEAVAHIFGYAPGELIHERLDCLIPKAVRSNHKKHLEAFFGQPKSRPMGKGLPIEFLGLRKDGSLFPVEITISPLEIGGELFAVAIVRDSTERQRIEQRIRRELEAERSRALTDDLTGLANRRYFHDALNHSIQVHQDYQEPFSLAYIDLDGFKAINDNQGHQTGDQLLQRIAAIMKRSSRSEDTLARIGGDEFALIISNASKEVAATVLNRLHKLVSEDLTADHIPTSMSIGWVHSSQLQLDSYRDLMHAADEAMYAAKNSGKNAVFNYKDIANQRRRQ